MKAENPSKKGHLGFKISPRLIDLFGKELVAKTEAALAEFVKNSYDSDASRVVLKFENVSKKGGTLTITDDGDGMSRHDLETKWMLIGTRDKIHNPRTRGKKRRKVGEKGIGRLGAHRLSNLTEIRTKKKGQTHWTVLNIDWSRYETDKSSFEEIVHPYRQEKGKKNEHGTIIKLLNLRDGFSEKNFQRLQEELTLLVPPLPGLRNFKIEILSTEFPKFKGVLEPSILRAATYTVEADYDGTGKLTGHLKVAGKKRPIPILSEDIEASHCGAFKIFLYAYILDKKSFQGMPIQLGKAREALKHFSGVRIYRDSFKVGSYGDHDRDWLGLDEQHLKAHEVALYVRQVIGAIHISRDDNPNLIDTTNREGLVANPAYFDLLNVCQLAVAAINEQRWQEREERTEKQKKSAKAPIDKALDRIKQSAQQDLLIPQAIKGEINEAVEQVRHEHLAHSRRLEDELQMYRNLASLGISAAAFAHETEAIGLDLELYARRLRRTIERLPKNIAKQLEPDFQELWSAAQRSIHYEELILDFVRKKKQKPSKLLITAVLKEVVSRYEPFLLRMKVQPNVKTKGQIPRILAIQMDIEAIFINLLTNSAWAMRNSSKRELLFVIEGERKRIRILASDSGGGVKESLRDKIFIPFYTTKKEKGIGLGLTIVKDTVSKYGGTVTVSSPGDLGGATFEIILPTKVPKPRL